MGDDQGQPKAGKPGSAETGEPKPPESPWTGLLKDATKQLIPVVLTAGSLIGFVAFAGAVIVWTRFYAIEVPPEQAVKAVPRDELVATGSSLLLLFGFFGVLALIGAYLVDRGGRATPGMSRALLFLLGVEGITAILTFDDDWGKATVGAITVFVLCVLVATAVTFRTLFARYSDQLPSRPKEHGPAVRGHGPLRTRDGKPRLRNLYLLVVLALLTAAIALVAVLFFVEPCHCIWGPLLAVAAAIAIALLYFLWLAGREIWTSAKAEGTAEPDCVVPEELPEEERLSKPRPHRLVMTWEGVFLLGVLAALAVVLPAVVVGEWWLAAPLGIAMVLGIGVWRIAVLSKPQFMWFGFAVFLSAPLFGTFNLMAHNVADPQVQPVALIRSTDGPGESIQGIYVTEGSDRVYFANVATEGCENEVTDDSGRLLWVPRDEVVAMSVGPLQDIDDAGLSALEMAYALTPDVETPTGDQVSLLVEEKGGGEAGGATGPEGGEEPPEEDIAEEEVPPDGEGGEEEESEAPPSTPDAHRLESAGPAIRPNFGAGLKLVPADAEPGQVVELRMSAPNPDPEVNGFGDSPEGHNLRLNGVRLAILRVPARTASAAEYAKTEGGTVLGLDGMFFVPGAEGGWFVRLDEDSVTKVRDGHPEGGLSLKLGAEGTLASHEDDKSDEPVPPSVDLANGESVNLRPQLRRRAWTPTRIKFRVPDEATTGVVAVECGQLAGQPVLTVVQPPTARVTVRMRTGSQRVVFDSSRSTDEAEEELARRWTVAGRAMGGKPKLPVFLQSRLRPYSVSLTVTDAGGQSDTVSLRLLRLPSSRFRFASNRPRNKKVVRRVREAVREAVEEEAPAAIELHGHADAVGSNATNQKLSSERVERMREMLFARATGHGAPIPMTVRAFGETCPIVRSSGRKAVNRRVEVFLLGSGAIVATPGSCRPGHVRRSSW